MRTPSSHLGVIFVCLAVAGLGACGGPKYPACEKDDHCKETADGTAINEYCVNGQCQQCRSDRDCPEGNLCNGGRCDQITGWCKSDGDCADGQLCQTNSCTDIQCSADEDCQGGERCSNGQCLAGGCVSDQECGAGLQCVDGSCQSASDSISASCRPQGGTGDVVQLSTVTFEFNKDDLTVGTRRVLEQNAECLREAQSVTVIIEGHCDERGTQEYNLALGERRSNAVRTYLRNLGVDTSRMQVRSKGKNEPVCQEATEACFARNRRVEFIQRRDGGF